MVPSAFVAFFIGHAIMQPHHQAVAFGASGVVRALFGAGLYLTVIGLFGLALGAIVRNTAGGIALFAAIMFVLPPLMNVLPTSWNNAASPSSRCKPASVSFSSKVERSRRSKASQCCAVTPWWLSSSPPSFSSAETSDR